MISREELIKTPEYWFENIQNEIYRQVSDYIKNEGVTQTQLAEKLGVTKGYISQIMNGNFNYTIKKLIELSLAIDKLPVIEFKAKEVSVKQEDVKQDITKHALYSYNPFIVYEQNTDSDKKNRDSGKTIKLSDSNHRISNLCVNY